MSSVKIVLFTSKVLKNGEHPIMVRHIENRKPKYISMGYSCKAEWWDQKLNGPNKKHPQQKELTMLLLHKMKEIQKTIIEKDSQEEHASFDDIKKTVVKTNSKISLQEYCQQVAARFSSLGKESTATSYMDFYRMFGHFTTKSVYFHSINGAFLQTLEDYMRKTNLAETTMSIYMRVFRSLFNKAIADGIVKESLYPFDKYKISKFDTSTQKRALTKDQIKIIEALVFEAGSAIWYTQQYFMFSYYCQGINFKDMALLKWDSLHGADRIIYERAKTGDKLNILLLPPAQKILDYFFQHRDESPYIFPILSDFHDTEKRIFNRLKKMNREINHDLKDIAKKAKIKGHLTFYAARHTYATVLRREGVQVSTISQSLGHSDERTTQIYLDSIENTAVDKAMERLL